MKQLSTVACVFLSLSTMAQEHSITINPNIHLPKDSVVTTHLVADLNGFLASVEKTNEENSFILPAERIETFVLTDEIRDIEKSGKYKDDHFYKPYLTNVVPLNDSTYLLELAYMGIYDNTVFLRAGFELIAHSKEKSFLFSSPLLMRTKSWKTRIFGNTIFHYRNALNIKNVKKHIRLTGAFDKKLSITNELTEFYCCDDLQELCHLVGVTYKADYNGKNEMVWSAVLENKKIIALANNNASFSEFDPHDLWHERLSLVIPRSLVNKAVDEGCAYLYGGSWGMSWEAVFNEFLTTVATNENADWADYKENPVYFKTLGYDNSADYIVNALLVQKIEAELGFAGVWKLLNCGKAEPGNENYYQVLESLTGITQSNYNEKVWELIDAERQKH